jgi:hypothetical protein
MTSLHRTLLLALALSLPALARSEDLPRWRAHPELAARLAAVRTVGLAVPEVKAFELTASNQAVFRSDWTDQSRELVAAALEEVLRAHGLAAKRLAPAPPDRPGEAGEVRRLYEAVVGAVSQATYQFRFPAKVERFEYELGDVASSLGADQVDAVLFTYGRGVSSTGGRKAIQALGAALAGVSSSGVDRLQIGLVDRSGTLLWFSNFASTKFDLRDAGSVKAFVAELADGFPGVAR